MESWKEDSFLAEITIVFRENFQHLKKKKKVKQRDFLVNQIYMVLFLVQLVQFKIDKISKILLHTIIITLLDKLLTHSRYL